MTHKENVNRLTEEREESKKAADIQVSSSAALFQIKLSLDDQDPNKDAVAPPSPPPPEDD